MEKASSKFLIIPAAIILILVAGIIWYLNFSSVNAKAGSNIAPKSENNILVNYPVKILLTVDGIEGDSLYASRYPKKKQIYLKEDISKKVSLFGAAYDIWPGLKGWTGKGANGVDGNVAVSLYPKNGSTKSGPFIFYYEVPACNFCMLSTAAPFFAGALKEYNEQYNADGNLSIDIDKTLKIDTISKTLLKYTRITKSGLLVNGIIYFNLEKKGEDSLFLAEFCLPQNDDELLQFLMDYYIKKEGLK